MIQLHQVVAGTYIRPVPVVYQVSLIAFESDINPPLLTNTAVFVTIWKMQNKQYNVMDTQSST